MSTNFTKSVRRAAAGAGVAAAVAATSLVAGAGAAYADHGINTTQNVNIRQDPNTTSAILGVVPAHTSPTYNCWTRGEAVHGLNVWFNISYNGATGFITSYYDDSHYIHAEDITAKYGIAQCGSTPPPPPPPPPASGATPAAQAAAAWASSQLGSTAWPYRCLAFVRTAWANQGVNLRSQVNITWGSNTYPADLIGHITGGQWLPGQWPSQAGDLVIFTSPSGRTMSHIVIYRGDGNSVSTDDYLGHGVHLEGGTAHRYLAGTWRPAG